MIEDELDLHASGETCLVCSKSVEHDRAYCRILHKQRVVNLCCPLCLETFTGTPEAHLSKRKTAEELRVVYDLLKSQFKSRN